jgi:hypothetical protein
MGAAAPDPGAADAPCALDELLAASPAWHRVAMDIETNNVTTASPSILIVFMDCSA